MQVGLGPTHARGLYRRSGVQALAARHPAPKATTHIQLFVKYITNLSKGFLAIVKQNELAYGFRQVFDQGRGISIGVLRR